MSINELINTKAGQDLLNQGKLPPVEVKIQTESIVLLAVFTVIASVLIILATKVLK